VNYEETLFSQMLEEKQGWLNEV